MKERTRQRMACLSYWLLFIVLPCILIGGSIELTVRGILILLMSFLGLVLFGEHGYRHWRRFWRLPNAENCSITDSQRF